MNPLLEFYIGDVTSLVVMLYVAQATAAVTLGVTGACLFRWNAAARHRILALTWLVALTLPLAIWISQTSGVSKTMHAWIAKGHQATVPYAHPDPQTTGGARSPSPGDVPSWNGVLPLSNSCRALLSLFFLVWLGGCLTRLTRLVGSFLKLSRRLRRSVAAKPGGQLDSVCNEVASDYLISSTPKIRISDENTTPAVAGFWKPTIIFPKTLVHRLTDEQLRHVVIHEMAHVARRDHLVVILQNLTAVVFWFHPLIHLLNRQLALAREELCDNYALRRIDNAAYGYTLLHIAESISPSAPSKLSAGLLTEAWPLEARISRILDPKRKTVTRMGPIRAFMTGVGAFVIVSAMALAHPAWDGAGDVPAPASKTRGVASEPHWKISVEASTRLVSSQERLVELGKMSAQLQKQKQMIERDLLLVQVRIAEERQTLERVVNGLEDTQRSR